MTCELCLIRSAEMDFNCLMPTFGVMVRGFVCSTCWAEAEHDMKIAAQLVKNRLEKRGMAREYTIEELARILPTVAEPDKEEGNGRT